MSIAKKVTLVVSLLAGLLLIGIGYAGTLYQQRSARAQAVRQAKQLSEILLAAAHVSVRDHGHLGVISDLTSDSRSAGVVFYGPDGRAIAPVPVEEKPVVNARARRVISREQREEEMALSGDQPTYVIRAPLFRKKKVVGAMELRVAVAQQLSLPAVILLVAGGLLVLFALLVWYFSWRAIGRPISSLMDGMDEVIQGDLTAALPLERSDEIGRIAYRFNEMTAQLRAAQDEIRAAASERLHLEQSLRHSEKLATIGQLSAEIGHEVGTPLNVIGGRARVLQRKADQPEEVLKNANIIAEQATRITKIIQQMLDLARARVPKHGSVDIGATVQKAITFLEYQTERSKIDVVYDLPADLPQVHGNADGLQQVVLNLMLNAIQAMPSGGVLQLSTACMHRRKEGLDLAPPQQYVVLAVADSGSGIDPEKRQQIFDPFYSTKHDGTGLGLTVVHGIVKEHDGWIEVEPGKVKGTLFRVYLPTESQQQEDAASDDSASTPSTQNSSAGAAEEVADASDGDRAATNRAAGDRAADVAADNAAEGDTL